VNFVISITGGIEELRTANRRCTHFKEDYTIKCSYFIFVYLNLDRQEQIVITKTICFIHNTSENDLVLKKILGNIQHSGMDPTKSTFTHNADKDVVLGLQIIWNDSFN